jgi:hypothetical protein
MANIPSEADRLLEAGRKKILRTCLLWGGPLLAILVLAGFQYAGAIRLEEYFAAAPNKVAPRVIWQVLAVLALLQFLFVAIGVRQGWVCMRRAKQLRQPIRRNRQGIPRPPHYSVKDDGRVLRISNRWIWCKFIGPAMMCLAWNGFVVFGYWCALRTGGRIMWLPIIVLIPHAGIGVLLVYATLAGLLNRTVIKVTSEFLTVRNGPVPWWGNRRLPIDELERLYCEKDTDPEKQGWTYVYGVHALTKAASKVDLVTELERAQALFIKQELDRWLNSEDHGVGGEIHGSGDIMDIRK